MESTTTARAACAHCGLPVFGAAPAHGEEIFCCYGCYLARRIVGSHDEESVQAWTILRLGVGALLAMNVMMISLLLYTGQLEVQTVPWFRWIMFVLATPAMLILGYPFVQGALSEMRRLRLRLDTLIACGAFAAFGVSAVNTVRGAGHVYFDTATMLPLLVTAGKLLEASAKTRTSRLMRSLEEMLPRLARRLSGGLVEEVPPGTLRTGDRVLVPPGEGIPVDGRIVEGSAVLEEAAFTGESRPRFCSVGDSVLAGTVNGPSALVVEAACDGGEILLRRIIGMVDEARWRPSPSERMADRVAQVFTPLVLILAAGVGAFWWLAEGPTRAGWVALSVLVVACPCAMGVAAPLVTSLAIGRAARSGVLVRGGDVLEHLGRANVAFFDKTGTITTREPRITAVESCDAAATPGQVLSWTASLESSSEHCIGQAVVAEARRRNLPLGTASEVRAFPGQGVRGTVALDGIRREVVAGTRDFVVAGPGSTAGAVTSIEVGWDGAPRGRILLSETPRPDARQAVEAMHRRGIRTVLLSGDRYEVARSVGDQVGIETTQAPRRPDEKIAVVAAAGRAIMVGDGINDAPALAAAQTGIALGAGTDLARQAGNVALLSDRLLVIPWLVDLSRKTRRIVAQNLAWAFGYNALALVAAAVGWLHPLLAALAMMVSSLTVLGNALRIRKFRDPVPAFG